MRRFAFAAKHATKSASFNCNNISLSVEANSKASSLSWLITDRSFVFTKVTLEKLRNSYYVHFYFFPPAPATHHTDFDQCHCWRNLTYQQSTLLVCHISPPVTLISWINRSRRNAVRKRYYSFTAYYICTEYYSISAALAVRIQNILTMIFVTFVSFSFPCIPLPTPLPLKTSDLHVSQGSTLWRLGRQLPPVAPPPPCPWRR